ncbi:endopeptidase La [Ruthenibacterium sp. TH_2024_36131]|uniref:endopeptidase La n=1 Tax=Owariibacterium komagatae TaxID=3136601 RepID=UPI0038B2437A
MSEKVKIILDKNADILRLPAIALRGLVVFPGNVIHFEVGRPKSIAAIEWAMNNNNAVFLTAQQDMDVEDPGFKDVYPYGVVAEIKQVLRVSDDLVKVLVEGKYRAKLLTLDSSGRFLLASTKASAMRGGKSSDPARIEALLRSIKTAFEEYIGLNTRMPKDVVYTIITSDSAAFLCDYIPGNLLLKYTDKQLLLNEGTLLGRLEKILEVLRRETKILRIEKDIQTKVNEQMDKNQRDYYLREQMRVISDELDDSEDTRKEAEEYRARIDALQLPEEASEKLRKEADRLYKMQGNTQEASVIRTYLDTCLDLPWHVFTPDNLDIQKAQALLDKEHYGLKKVKERILEILAVRKLAPDVKGQIICLVGPPGVGKTSIARSIAQCLGRKYARMSLGGVRDEAEIRGHRRTYIGAMPGKIINAILTAKSSNPLLLLDEVDKLASDFRGDPAAALLEALDPEQNVSFKDHYLDIPFDLSDVLFITTANTLDTIPRPLLDRMDVIELSSYTRVEKFEIAKRHLVPKQLAATGLKGKVKLNQSAIYGIIDGYTQEAGVRNLERTITQLLRKCAKQIAAGTTESMTIGASQLEELLGPKRVKPAFHSRKDSVGVANGLAWTSVGGEILPIEVQVVPGGSGRLELTGSLGEVMKESAKLAITYAKVHASEYGYAADVFKNADIHIHAPEGAIPKDGPSAGVTLTTALISCLSGRAVRSDVAMTGEITLHGQVLPIGGLKEKSMAAYREHMSMVLIPKDNEPDLYEVDPVVKQALEFHPVSSLEEVLSLALLKDKKKAKHPEKAEKKVQHPVPEIKTEQPLAIPQ